MSSSQTGSLSQAAGIAAQFGISLPNNQAETKWVYTEIIKSRTLAKNIIKKKFDTEEFGIDKSLLQILTYGNDEKVFGEDTLVIKAVDALLSLITVSEDIKTGIFTLKVEASEPSLAASINNTIINELDSHQRTYNKTRTSETRKFIEERILNTESELQLAEEKLKVFRDRNRRIENSPALLLEQQRLNREVAVLTGVFTTLKQQLETTKIEEVKDSDYVLVVDKPEIPLKKSKPNKKMSVVLAGIFGIGLGTFLGFIIHIFQKLDPKELQKIDSIKGILISKLKELLFLK
jgi:uncharacterized protein involved in exopolysaccharide biosynthesis